MEQPVLVKVTTSVNGITFTSLAVVADTGKGTPRESLEDKIRGCFRPNAEIKSLEVISTTESQEDDECEKSLVHKLSVGDLDFYTQNEVVAGNISKALAKLGFQEKFTAPYNKLPDNETYDNPDTLSSILSKELSLHESDFVCRMALSGKDRRDRIEMYIDWCRNRYVRGKDTLPEDFMMYLKFR